MNEDKKITTKATVHNTRIFFAISADFVQFPLQLLKTQLRSRYISVSVASSTSSWLSFTAPDCSVCTTILNPRGCWEINKPGKYAIWKCINLCVWRTVFAPTPKQSGKCVMAAIESEVNKDAGSLTVLLLAARWTPATNLSTNLSVPYKVCWMYK